MAKVNKYNNIISVTFKSKATTDVNRLSKSFQKLIDSIDKVEKSVNASLSKVAKSFESIGKMSEPIDAVSKSLVKPISNLSKLASSVKSTFGTVSKSLGKASASVESAIKSINKLVSSAASGFTKFAQEAKKAATKISSSLSSVSFKGLANSVKSASKSLKSISLDELIKSFKKLGGSISKIQESLNSISSSKLVKSLSQISKALDMISRDAIASFSKLSSSSASAASKISNSFKGVSTQELNKNLSALQSQSESTVSSMGKGFSSVLPHVDALTLAVGALTAAATAAMGVFLKSVVDFADQANLAANRVAQSIGIPLDQASRLKDELVALYRKGLGDSMQDISDVASEVGQHLNLIGKLSQENFSKLTEGALVARSELGRATSETLKFVSASVDAFGVGIDDALTTWTTSIRGGLNLTEDLSDTVAEYGRLLSSAGTSYESFMTILQSGTQLGTLGTAKITDFLKELLLSLQEGPKEVADTINSIGLNFDKIQAKVASGQDQWGRYFEKIIEGIAGLDSPLAQSEALRILGKGPGEDLGRRFLAEFKKVQSAIKDTVTVTELLENRYRTIPQTIEDLKRSSLAAFEPIGQAILKIIRPVLPSLESGIEKASAFIVSSLSKVSHQVEALVNDFAKFIGIDISKFATTWDVMAASFEKVKSSVSALVSPITSLMSEISSSLGVTFGFEDALIAVGTATAAFAIPAIGALLSLMSPFIAAAISAVSAIKLVRVAIANNFGGIADFLHNVKAAAISGFSDGGLVSAIHRAFNEVASYLQTVARNMPIYGKNIAVSLANGIIAGVSSVVNSLRQIGRVITYWLKPGSPPRLLPELENWGAGAASAYFDGWKQADFSAVDSLSQAVSDSLSSMADALPQEDIALFAQKVKIDFGQVISEVRQFGNESPASLDRVKSSVSNLHPEVSNLIDSYVELTKESIKLEKINEELEASELKLAQSLKKVSDAEREREKLSRKLREEQRLLKKQEEAFAPLRSEINSLQREAARLDIEKAASSAKVRQAEKRLADFEKTLIPLQDDIAKAESRLARARDKSTAAQNKLNKAIDKYQKKLAPIQKELEGIRRQQADLQDKIRLEEIDVELAENKDLSADERQLLLLEKQEIARNKSIRAIEAEQQAATAGLERRVSLAEKIVATEEKRVDKAREALESARQGSEPFIQQIELLKQSVELIDQQKQSKLDSADILKLELDTLMQSLEPQRLIIAELEKQIEARNDNIEALKDAAEVDREAVQVVKEKKDAILESMALIEQEIQKSQSILDFQNNINAAVNSKVEAMRQAEQAAIDEAEKLKESLGTSVSLEDSTASLAEKLEDSSSGASSLSDSLKESESDALSLLDTFEGIADTSLSLNPAPLPELQAQEALAFSFPQIDEVQITDAYNHAGTVAARSFVEGMGQSSGTDWGEVLGINDLSQFFEQAQLQNPFGKILEQTDFSSVHDAWQKTREIFDTVYQSITERLAPALARIGESLSLIPWQSLLESVGKVAFWLGEKLLNIVLDLGSLGANVLTGFGEIAVGVFGGVIDIISLLAVGLEGLVTGDFETFRSKSVQIFENFSQNVELAISGLKTVVVSIVESLVTSVIGFFQGLYDTLVGNSIVTDLTTRIEELFFNMSEVVSTKISAFASGLVEEFNQFRDSSIKSINKFKDSSTRKFEEFKRESTKRVKQAIDRIVDFVENLPSRVREFVQEFIDMGGDMGKKLINGFVESIRDSVGKIKDAIVQVIKEAIALLPSFEIPTPSFGGGGGDAPSSGRGPEPTFRGFVGATPLNGRNSGQLYLSGSTNPEPATIINDYDYEIDVDVTVENVGSDVDVERLARQIARKIKVEL